MKKEDAGSANPRSTSYETELYGDVNWERVRRGDKREIAKLEQNARAIVTDRAEKIRKGESQGKTLADNSFRAIRMDKLAAEITLSMIQSWHRGARGEEIIPSEELKQAVLKLAAELSVPLDRLPKVFQKAINKLVV